MSVESAPAEGALLELSLKSEGRDAAADEAEAIRIIQELLHEAPPELIASFEPGFVAELYGASGDDEQNQAEINKLMQEGFLERVQALTEERVRLLAELQQFNTLPDESLEKAMEDPAMFVQNAVLAFRARCEGRVVLGDSHYLSGQHQYSHHFALAGQRYTDSEQSYSEPELLMRVGYAVDAGSDAPEAKFFQIQTIFRRDHSSRKGSAYDFYVGSNGELQIEKIQFSRGIYRRRRVTDRAESYQLLQTLVRDMRYELEHFDDQQDEEVKKLTKLYIKNRASLS